MKHKKLPNYIVHRHIKIELTSNRADIFVQDLTDKAIFINNSQLHSS